MLLSVSVLIIFASGLLYLIFTHKRLVPMIEQDDAPLVFINKSKLFFRYFLINLTFGILLNSIFEPHLSSLGESKNSLIMVLYYPALIAFLLSAYCTLATSFMVKRK